MEHDTSALIFPETEPDLADVAKFLLFFDAVAYYRPTESDGTARRAAVFFTNLCTEYAPAPLGDDLGRFNRLLRDMETSGPDEFSRLFAAARPPGLTGQVRDHDETSAGKIYSALHKEAGTEAAVRHKERLWQARLILKLAEMLARKEAEIRQGLAQVSAIEQKLFASLAGPGQAEGDEPEALPGLDKLLPPKADRIQAKEPLPATPEMLTPLRVKAWAELYLADPSDRRPRILVTANQESGALLLDCYENTWRHEPVKMFSLAVPALRGAAAEETPAAYLAARNTFRRAAHDNLEYFAEFLRKTTRSVGPVPACQDEISVAAENISAWEKQVKAHFSGPGNDLFKLDFYCFPATSITVLFQHLSHQKELAAEDTQKLSPGLLAILRS